MRDRQSNLLTACGRWANPWLHFDGRGASWLRFISPRTDSPFICKTEKREYEARQGTSINEWFARLPADPSLCDQLGPILELCAFSFPYQTSWFVSPTPEWRDALDFEHRLRERLPPHLVLAGWHNVEVYALRPAARARYYVSAMRSEWHGLETNRMLLVFTSLFSSYYSNMVLAGPNRSAAFLIAHTEFAVSVVMQFPIVASAGVTHTFSFDDCLALGQPCFIALQNAVFDLVTDFGVFAITCRYQFNLVLALCACSTMHNVFWATVSKIPQCRWLPYSFTTGRVRLSPRSGCALVLQEKRSNFGSRGFCFEVDQVNMVPSSSAICRATADFLYEEHGILKPDALPNEQPPLFDPTPPAFLPESVRASTLPSPSSLPYQAITSHEE